MQDFETQVEEIKKMPQAEFEIYIRDLADDIWTFPGLVPPDGARYIGQVNKNRDTYYYYLAPDGDYYFETESGYQWKRKMDEFHRFNS